MSATELVGYVASGLVVLSLTMTSVVRLRVISFAGSLTFVVYGVLIESIPIVITNGSIMVINVWFLARELWLAGTHHPRLGASVIRPDSPFLLDFVEFHRDDICSFQPDFELPAGDDAFALVLTRDGLPAGLLLGRRSGDELAIDLDYVLAAYRDSRLGRWLFGPGADVLRDQGIGTVTATALTDTHARYLERVGFTRSGDRLTLPL